MHMYCVIVLDWHSCSLYRPALWRRYFVSKAMVLGEIDIPFDFLVSKLWMDSFVHKFTTKQIVVHKLLMAALIFGDDIYTSKEAY